MSNYNTFLNSEEYYDNVSHLFEKYDTYQSYLFGTIENTHKILANLIKNKNLRILDLGCGIGSFINYLNNNGFINTMGVVNSQKIFNISKKKYNINIVKEDMIKYMSQNKKSYDVIFNIESVGYVDIDEYFNKAHECLDDNGIIILKDYTAIGDPKETGKYYGNYIFYNHEIIIKTAEKYGFRKVFTKLIDSNKINNIPFLNALHEINQPHITSSLFNNMKNVIKFAIYCFIKV